MEAPAFRCEACGALLAEGALSCSYCHAVVDTVSCPHCLGLVNARASHCIHCGQLLSKVETHAAALACPQCHTIMKVQAVEESEFAQCGTCGGIWMDHERFRTLSAARVETGLAAHAGGARPASGMPAPEPIHYRPCPVCRQFMNRINFGKHSGVILDTCKSHGLWFDLDELRRVLAFIETGGLARTEQLQAESDQEASRAMARVQIESQLTHPSVYQENTELDFGEVMGALAKVGRWLLR